MQKLGREVQLSVSVEQYDVVEAESSTRSSSSGAFGHGLSILKARVSLIPTGGSERHVEYRLRVVFKEPLPVSAGGGAASSTSWTLQKRFSEVAELHGKLAARLQVPLPEAPPKTTVRQFSPESLESRKAALNQYFQALCQRRDVMNCTEVHFFFGLPQHVQGFPQTHASEPVEVAEIFDDSVHGLPSYALVDFACDPARGLLIIGSTDASWTSRMELETSKPVSQIAVWRQSEDERQYERHFTYCFTVAVHCVVLATLSGHDMCFCGLGNGEVGCQDLSAQQSPVFNGMPLPMLKHKLAVLALAFDEIEGWLASASKDMSIIFTDMIRRQIISNGRTPAPTVQMKHCAEQKKLFCGLQDGSVLIWDTSAFPAKQACTLPADAVEPGRISALDYDASNEILFTAGKERITLWKLFMSPSECRGRKFGRALLCTSQATALAWLASSREIVAGFANGTVTVFDVDSSRETASYGFQAHSAEAIATIVWLDAPRRLLTASRNKTVKLWDFPSMLSSLETPPVLAWDDEVSPRSAPNTVPLSGGSPATTRSMTPVSPQGAMPAVAEFSPPLRTAPKGPCAGLAEKSSSSPGDGDKAAAADALLGLAAAAGTPSFIRPTGSPTPSGSAVTSGATPLRPPSPSSFSERTTPLGPPSTSSFSERSPLGAPASASRRSTATTTGEAAEPAALSCVQAPLGLRSAQGPLSFPSSFATASPSREAPKLKMAGPAAPLPAVTTAAQVPEAGRAPSRKPRGPADSDESDEDLAGWNR